MSSSCKKQEQLKEKISGAEYKIYYFHPTARCVGCINIETFTKGLIDSKYKSNPAIKFEVLNIEDPKNEHFRKDYNLKFGSVVITKAGSGGEEKFKNLDSIWTYSEDSAGFFKYMDREIKEFIK